MTVRPYNYNRQSSFYSSLLPFTPLLLLWKIRVSGSFQHLSCRADGDLIRKRPEFPVCFLRRFSCCLCSIKDCVPCFPVSSCWMTVYWFFLCYPCYPISWWRLICLLPQICERSSSFWCAAWWQGLTVKREVAFRLGMIVVSVKREGV